MEDSKLYGGATFYENNTKIKLEGYGIEIKSFLQNLRVNEQPYLADNLNFTFVVNDGINP